MKLLLIADFRNPHAQAWSRHLMESVDLLRVSSQYCEPDNCDVTLADPIARVRQAVVASGVNQRIRIKRARREHPTSPEGTPQLDPLQRIDTVLAKARSRTARRQLLRLTETYRPDLIHGLRIPYEGLFALSLASLGRPVIVSSWGQDFISQALADPRLSAWMRRKLPTTSGFITDTATDLPHAIAHGVSPSIPTLIVPGNVGVDTDLFYPEQQKGPAPIKILYPRGVRSYVRHHLFLELAQAFAHHPGIEFVGIGLARDSAAMQVARLNGVRLRLTDHLSREQFAREMRSTHIVVSPSQSDGTPNSILEAAACGAYVLAGNIPSTNELSSSLGDRLKLLSLETVDPWADAVHSICARIERSPRDSLPAYLPSSFHSAFNQQQILDFYSRVLAQVGRVP